MSVSRPVFVAVAAALLLAGIYTAGMRGAADVRNYTARTLLAQAGEAKRPLTEGELNLADSSLRSALALEPSNPQFIEQLAHAHELRALMGRPGRPARASLRRALAQYRGAALMRPGSGYVWASIAMLKVRLDEMDFEFYGSLERAGRLAPWEPRVQIAMVDVGLASWRWLAAPAKDWVLAALERALLRQEPEVRRIAEFHGGLSALCAQGAKRAPRTAAFCVQK